MTKPKKNNLNKNDLPVLDSDDDFLNAFEAENRPKSGAQKDTIPDNFATEQNCRKDDDYSDNEDFATMLEESFKIKKNRALKKQNPLPLKKRLKRYPGVERELDLPWIQCPWRTT